MPKTIFCGLCLFLMPLATVAQSSSAQSHDSMRVVEGCLSQIDKGHYAITGQGPTPKQFRLVGGDPAELSRLLEHTVRATGLVGQSDPSQQVTTPPSAGSTTGATYGTIEVQQVKDVTSNCSVPGSEGSK